MDFNCHFLLFQKNIAIFNRRQMASSIAHKVIYKMQKERSFRFLHCELEWTPQEKKKFGVISSFSMDCHKNEEMVIEMKD